MGSRRIRATKPNAPGAVPCGERGSGGRSKICSTSGVYDAEEVGWQGPNRPSRLPGHAAIWVRVEGGWRAGHVHRWILGVDPERWLAWTSYTDPAGGGAPRWGLFRYDAKVLCQRHGDRPPDAPELGQDQTAE